MCTCKRRRASGNSLPVCGSERNAWPERVDVAMMITAGQMSTSRDRVDRARPRRMTVVSCWCHYQSGETHYADVALRSGHSISTISWMIGHSISTISWMIEKCARGGSQLVVWGCHAYDALLLSRRAFSTVHSCGGWVNIRHPTPENPPWRGNTYYFLQERNSEQRREEDHGSCLFGPLACASRGCTWTWRHS